MKDIILTSDIQIANGDLVVDISDIQHVEHILQAVPGQYYQNPTIGYGVNRKLNGRFDANIETQNLKKALSMDDILVNNISIIPSGSNFAVSVKIKPK